MKTCMDVMETLLADDRGRAAWLVGFMIGSSLKDES